MDAEWMNKLYFGDNLEILRHHVADESVDLIYLDPPFNSQASYNVLFRETNGTGSAAQIRAFDDSWHWDMGAALAFHEAVTQGPPRVAGLLEALRRFLGQNDMMAYLTMMAVRLVELRRVLKPTGSLYLHCDPVASHYLKVLLDAVFEARHFRHEIIWKCTSAHSNTKTYGNIHQSLLFYSRTDEFTFHIQYAPYEQSYVEQYYRYQDPDGRRFMSADLVGHKGVNPEYEWRGITRPWRYPEHRLDELDREGRVFWTRNDFPRYKRYLDEMPGMPAQTIWADVLPVVSWSKERLGYPTQKPEALLERIIRASSDEGDVVLDPFCGCGTTVVVAERLHRRWTGIDITHLAIALMKNRLHDAFGSDLNPYRVYGEPQDLPSARALAQENRHQFQYWALSLVAARPAGEPRKGPDRGIDGLVYFMDDDSGKAKRVVLQVKSGHVSVAQVRDLKGVLEREQAEMGALITLEEPTRAMREEAAATGFYEPPSLLPPVPRLQVLTIEELLGEKKLDYPAVAPATFRRAPRQTKAKRKGGPL